MKRGLNERKELKIERRPRLKLSAKESLKRTKEFDKRKEKFIAAVRRGLDELNRGEAIPLEEVEDELPSWIIK